VKVCQFLKIFYAFAEFGGVLGRELGLIDERAELYGVRGEAAVLIVL